MHAPADRPGDAAHQGFADDEIADTAFVDPAAVVDDEYIPALRRGNRLEEDVGAATMTRRPGWTRHLTAWKGASPPWRSDANRKQQLHAGIGDERRGPVEPGQKIRHGSIMTKCDERINEER